MISHSDLLLNAISYRCNENPYELADMNLEDTEGANAAETKINEPTVALHIYAVVQKSGKKRKKVYSM